MAGNYTETHYAHEFTALGGASLAENKAIIDAMLSTFEPPLSVPVNETRIALGGAALIVDWAGLPSADDVQRVADLIPTIEGVATTSEPFEIESLGTTTTTDTVTPVDKIDFATPPLDEGTYQVMWDCLVGMVATVANTGVKGIITLTRIRGASSVARTWSHGWNQQEPQLFGSGITFKCQAGDRIRAQLQVLKLGAAAATAAMAMARITIDQIARPGE
jgi:hypothetical protein